jgi:hypothetical protein
MRKHGILERRNEVGDFVAIIFPLNKDEKNRLQNDGEENFNRRPKFEFL